MNAIYTLFAWIIARAAEWRRSTSATPLAQEQPHQRDVAQVQDHWRDSARDPSNEREQPIDERDRAGPPAQDQRDERDRIRILLGPRIDGGTSWRAKARTADIRIYETVRAALYDERTDVIDLGDPWGEAIVMALERGSGGRIVASTGLTRLEVSRRRLDVQITAMASEVEGVERWWLRELRRAAWWSSGAAGLPGDVEGLGRALAELGIEQHAIHVCTDAQGGIDLVPGIEHHVITRLKVMPVVPKPGVIEGLNIGHRGNPRSMAIYAKLLELLAQRGPEHRALLSRLAEAGLNPERGWNRYELRLWGKALRLEHMLEGLDHGLVARLGGAGATHPAAALDDALIGRLWQSALTDIWITDPEHRASRARDRAEHPAWAKLRAAGGSPAKLRLTRVAAKAQFASTLDHARDRFGQAAADVDELVGDGDGESARAELDRVIQDDRRWGRHAAKAKARYAGLLDVQGEPR